MDPRRADHRDDNENELKNQPASPPTGDDRPSAAPDFEAVLPGSEEAEAEILGDINEYQRKIESDWESAKAAYQASVDRIMDEFLKERMAGEVDTTPSEPPAAKSGPAAPNRMGEPAPRPDPAKNWHAKAGRALRRVGEKHPQRLQTPALPAPRSVAARPWLRNVVFALCLSTAAAAGGVWWMRVPAVTDLPYPHASHPVVSDDAVYIVDWFRKSIFVHERRRGLKIRAVESLPNPFLAGFAIAGHAVFTADGLSGAILEHALTPDHRVLARHKSPGGKPSALFFDGTHLWSADAEAGKIYRHHARDPESVLASFALPGGAPTALAVRTNRLWILDGDRRVVTVYRMENPLNELASFDLDPFLDGAKPSGLALDDRTVWITTENPPRLLKLPASRLARSRPDRIF